MRRKIAELKKGDLPICKFYQPYHSVLKSESQYTKLAFNKGVFAYLTRMKQTAASYRLVYLTSNQVFSRESLFVIKKDFKDHSWIHESYNDFKSYRGYINPQIIQYKGQVVDVWQKCVSMPYVQCKVKRNSEIRVGFVDQNREKINQQLFGFKAYLYQHCIDHLKGKCVLNWDSSQANIRIYPEAEHFFPKTKFVLKDYSFRIKQALSKHISSNQGGQFVQTPEQKDLQNKQEEALRKSLSEQIVKLTQKYGSGL